MTQSVPFSVAVALGLITLLAPVSVDMYLPSLPVMAEEMNTTYPAMQLTLMVFLLAMGAGQIVFGPVIDAYGRRRPLLVALAIFVVASLCAAVAHSVEALLLARLLQGLAASLAIVTAMSTVRDIASGVAAVQIFALLMTIQGLGPVMAPVLGGMIGAGLGWRAVFYFLAALGAIVLANTFTRLPESLPPNKRSSLHPVQVWRTYVSIVMDRRFLVPGLALSGVFFILFGYIGGASYVYQSFYGLPSREFGFIFGATGIAVLIGAIICARLVKTFDVERLALAGVLAVGIGLPGIVAGMILTLAGLGTAEATLTSIALASRASALGASTALLGAVPLVLGAAATPLAALLAEIGPAWWLAFLALAGVVTAGLTLASLRMVAGQGVRVVQH
jgi:DHA1 family bicyclomycin/chloramphenicol resistance-like MFS transporter